MHHLQETSPAERVYYEVVVVVRIVMLPHMLLVPHAPRADPKCDIKKRAFIFFAFFIKKKEFFLSFTFFPFEGLICSLPCNLGKKHFGGGVSVVDKFDRPTTTIKVNTTA